MRVIIIEDKDAKALLKTLELAAFTHKQMIHDNVLKSGPEAICKQATENAHSWFHYHVVQWLQAQGANFL